ncbi:class I SAM-dependent methyltransferase [Psychromonas aquimarina]|uniref:class I SAM-dependent methyltransferase n=1 Tax=Psychromonas aquimarina TaxID=444919 RepID=UPI00040480FC|nr:class I SAM-dependent methyltransferase [Psychromonas aquimarina]
MSARSKDYIFQENEQGELKFIGDFEGFYQAEDDPWQQSGGSSDIAAYYKYSRQKIADYINQYSFQRVLEVGCGVGHSTSQLAKLIHRGCSGADISQTAVDKATLNYPHLHFFQLDICQPIQAAETVGKFDCVILNQVLWYIMHAMPEVKQNVKSLLAENGLVIFSTAFLKEQRYGQEFFNGYQGFIDYIQQHWIEDFTIEHKSYDASNNFDYHDGFICLGLISK